MTRLSVSVRELLDDDLVEQLTAETMDKPRARVVLLYRIALAAACVALVAGVTAAGIWMSRQPPKIAGPSAASSVSSAPGTGSTAPSNETGDLYSLLPPAQTDLPADGRTLPVYTLPSLTDAQMEAQLLDLCQQLGLTPDGEVFWEDTYVNGEGGFFRQPVLYAQPNPLHIGMLRLDRCGRLYVQFGNILSSSYYEETLPLFPSDSRLTASLPYVSEALALDYYQQLSKLFAALSLPAPAVESYNMSYAIMDDSLDGLSYKLFSEPYVTLYPKSTGLEAVANRGAYGVQLDINLADGHLISLTVAPRPAEEPAPVPVIREEEAVALWEQGTYLFTGFYEEPAYRDASQVQRIRLTYWEQPEQRQLIPVYILYVKDTRDVASQTPEEYREPLRYCVPAVSQQDADWSDIKLYGNDSVIRGTWDTAQR